MPNQFGIFALFSFDIIIDSVGKNQTMHLFFSGLQQIFGYTTKQNLIG